MKTQITDNLRRSSTYFRMRSPIRSNISLVLIAIVCVGLIGTSSAQTNDPQIVLYVKADAVGTNDGTGWADAYTDLQDALAVAAPDDEIWVAAGIYTPSGRTLRTATFQLITGVSIYGGFAGTEVMSSERDPAKNLTILSGDLLGNDLEVSEPSDLARESMRSDNSYHVVTGTAADETGVLDGFVVIGGNANGPEHLNGGGMINKWKDAQSGRNGTIGPFPASPTLVNCTFRGNSADRNGGAVYNERGMPTFIDCVFNANHADGGDFEEGGGGIYNDRGDLILRGCRFGENTSTGGAGLYNKNASPIVIDTVFDRNVIIGFSHDNNGGGILNSGSDATIINCTFTDNLASFGGGIWNYSAPAATIVNCIFSRNEAGHPSDGAGGGLQNWSSNPTVINCTFSENSAITIAGGLGEGGGSRTTVSNCIFWANSAKSAPQIGGGATDVTYSCVQGGKPGEGNIDMDPHFLDADGLDDIIGTPDDNLRFGRQSPCFDSGNDAALPLDSADLDGDGDTSERIPFDLDGKRRSYGNWVDMGAYEYTPATSFPANRTSDVFRDVVLTWKPGENFQTHNVYFGTSADAVAAANTANPLDVLISEGQDAASFDPGRLEFGGTYYWRVDDVNGSPDFAILKGDVWSFKVEPDSSPIPGDTVIATASSSSNEFSQPDKTIDGSGLGDDETHGIVADTMWFTASVDLDPWIQYEFDEVKKLGIMTVWNSNSAAEMAIGWGVKDAEIQYSADGENWDVLEGATQFSRAPGLPTYNQYDEINFQGAVAQYVRVNIQSNWGGILMAYGLSEVRFYTIPVYARNPRPEVGSITDSTDVVLNWHPGRVATSHDVLFSENLEAIEDGSALITNTTDSWMDLSDLNLTPSTTYYWQVNEVNDLADPPVYEGTVWHFTTPETSFGD